jgi:hypothetical protein
MHEIVGISTVGTTILIANERAAEIAVVTIAKDYGEDGDPSSIDIRGYGRQMKNLILCGSITSMNAWIIKSWIHVMVASKITAGVIAMMKINVFQEQKLLLAKLNFLYGVETSLLLTKGRNNLSFQFKVREGNEKKMMMTALVRVVQWLLQLEDDGS